jgi:rhodanese-related sulfurtransferase
MDAYRLYSHQNTTIPNSTMSDVTIGTLPRITREELSSALLSTRSGELITDSSDKTSSDASETSSRPALITQSSQKESSKTSSATAWDPPVQNTSSIAVIDVRDSDHVGGHIRGSLHVPSHELDWRLPELVRTLKDKDTVVFHCALSQQRGPKAALRYLREKDRISKTTGEAEDAKKQEVKVLKGGFVEWQEKYGTDKRLTDAYEKDIWESGFY